MRAYLKRKLKSILAALHIMDFIYYVKTKNIKRWVNRSILVLKSNDLNEFVFTQQNAYIRLPTGNEFLFCPDAPDSGTMKIRERNCYEIEERRLLARIMDEKGVFFDVGACFGLFALELAAQLPRIEVYAFEPAQQSYEVLVHNIERNNLASRVHAYRTLMYDEIKPMHMTSSGWEFNKIIISDNTDSYRRKQDVQSTTLDYFIREHSIKTVSMIKCDVEGAELHVLKGSIQALKELRPILMLEIASKLLEQFGHSPMQIDEFLSSLNYVKFDIAKTRGNKLFLPREKQELGRRTYG